MGFVRITQGNDLSLTTQCLSILKVSLHTEESGRFPLEWKKPEFTAEGHHWIVLWYMGGEGGTQKGDESQKLPLLFQCLYKVPKVFDHLQGNKWREKGESGAEEKQAEVDEGEERERKDKLVRL